MRAREWLGYAYCGISVLIALVLMDLHRRGRAPLSLGPPRVRWPLAPAPSLFLMVALLAAGAVAASAASGALGDGSEGPADLRARAVASLANYGTQLLLVAGIWWALAESIRRTPATPGDAVAPPMNGARAAAAGALAMAVGWPVVQASGLIASTIQQSLGGVVAPDTAHRTLEAMGQSGEVVWIAATAVVAVILAPLAEELLYRGALQQALHGLGMPRLLSLASASALFAVAHLGSLVAGGEASALTMLFVLGLIFGWIYERTGSVWAPFAAHALFNAANLAIFLAQR